MEDSSIIDRTVIIQIQFKCPKQMVFCIKRFYKLHIDKVLSEGCEKS